MTVTGIARLLRRLGIGLPILVLCVAPAAAQYPGQNPGGRSQTCLRLESQLATIDRGVAVDPARADQIKRYEDSSAKQQAEVLQRALANNTELIGKLDSSLREQEAEAGK